MGVAWMEKLEVWGGKGGLRNAPSWWDLLLNLQ